MPLDGAFFISGQRSAMFTDVFQATYCAIRTPGNADSSPVINEAVTKAVPFFRWNDLPKLFFHLGRFFYVVYKPNEVAEPDTVSICHNSRLPKYIPKDKIGALSSNSGEL